MTDSTLHHDLPSLPLDEKYYKLDEEERAFFKSQTGIQDDEALKEHMLQSRADAYRVRPYPCILIFWFARLRITRTPAYKQLLALGKDRAGAIFLDIVCCFGNDIRKAVADGFPISGVIGSDIEPAFWESGHKLFKTTRETYPVPFIPGDVFDESFIQLAPPFYSAPNLTPLQGHLSAIHASAFFHLFDEEKQLRLARLLAGLLSPMPGSLIFGAHGGMSEKGEVSWTTLQGRAMFCHSPESWRDLWDGQVFKKGTVRVEAQLHPLGENDFKPDTVTKADFSWLVWSVTRL